MFEPRATSKIEVIKVVVWKMVSECHILILCKKLNNDHLAQVVECVRSKVMWLEKWQGPGFNSCSAHTYFVGTTWNFTKSNRLNLDCSRTVLGLSFKSKIMDEIENSLVCGLSSDCPRIVLGLFSDSARTIRLFSDCPRTLLGQSDSEWSPRGLGGGVWSIGWEGGQRRLWRWLWLMWCWWMFNIHHVMCWGWAAIT